MWIRPQKMAIYDLFFLRENMHLRLHLDIFEERMIMIKSNSFKRHVRNKYRTIWELFGTVIFLKVTLHCVCGGLQKWEREYSWAWPALTNNIHHCYSIFCNIIIMLPRCIRTHRKTREQMDHSSLKMWG